MKHFSSTLVVIGVAFSLITPASAQEADAIVMAGVNAREIEVFEDGLKDAEKYRLAGNCRAVEWTYVFYMRRLDGKDISYRVEDGPPANLPPELKEDFKRRMEELARRECPPGSGRNLLGTAVEQPGSAPAPDADDSGDIFDNPDNAKAGVGLTPMDEPAKSPTKSEPLDGHEPFLEETGDENGATGTATTGKPGADPRPRPPPLPPRKPEEVHIPPKPVGTVPQPAPPVPPRTPEEIHVPPKPVGEPGVAPGQSDGSPAPNGTPGDGDNDILDELGDEIGATKTGLPPRPVQPPPPIGTPSAPATPAGATAPGPQTGPVQDLPPAGPATAPGASAETPASAPSQSELKPQRRKRDNSPDPPRQPGDPSPNPTPPG